MSRLRKIQEIGSYEPIGENGWNGWLFDDDQIKELDAFITTSLIDELESLKIPFNPADSGSEQYYFLNLRIDQRIAELKGNPPANSVRILDLDGK